MKSSSKQFHVLVKMKTDTAYLCRWNLERCHNRFLLVDALLVDCEREEVAVASDGEHKLVVETARQLGDDAVVVVVYCQAPVRTHQSRVVVVNRLDADASVRHSKHQVLRAVNSDTRQAARPSLVNNATSTLQGGA